MNSEPLTSSPLPLAALSTDELLRFIRDSIGPWVAARRGTLSIAADPWNVLEILGTRPGGFRVVVLWAGDKKRGEHEEAGVVDHSFQIVTGMGRALTREPGLHLADGASGAEPLYKLIGELREVLRGLQFPDGVTEGALNYLGTDSFTTPEGLAIDSYVSTFQLGAYLPEPTPLVAGSSSASSSVS